MFDQDWFYNLSVPDMIKQLKIESKKILQDWINLNAKQGKWVVYGTSHKYELTAKQHAGRLFVFKKGIKVVRQGSGFVVMFWEPI